MRVQVEYFAQLRTLGGVQQEDYDLPDGSGVDALLEAIKARHQGPLADILGGEGALPSWIAVLVNDNVLVGEATLAQDSTVRFLAPISGG